MSKTFFAVFSAAAVLFSQAAVAQDEAPSGAAVQNELITELVREPIKYRQYVKQAMQSHLAAFGLILTERAPHPEYLASHAAALVSLAREQVSAYPAGSETPSTKQQIWEDPETFADAAEQTIEKANLLDSAVESGNRHVMLNALVRLGESCESCHEQFRKDSD